MTNPFPQSTDDKTNIVLDWAVRSFGEHHVASLPIRALRCAEEVVELAQATGVEKEKLHHLIDVVYSRPPGEMIQELGGVMTVLTTICGVLGITTDEVFTRELRRVLAKPPKDFAQRNQDKIDLGLT